MNMEKYRKYKQANDKRC